MARKWEAVSLEEAQAHSLYGRVGWLILFVAGTLLGLAVDLGAFANLADALGVSVSQLWAAGTTEAISVQLSLALHVLTAAVILVLFALRSRWFRKVTSALLLASFPLQLLVSVPLLGIPGVAGGFTRGFIQWVVGCAVWVTYLQRSRRVRVTFEQRVLAGDAVAAAVSEGADRPGDGGSIPSGFAHAEPAPALPRMSASQRESTAAVTADDEALWAVAYDELHGSGRRQGLWARVFAEASGDEASAQAAYLRERVRQLSEVANPGRTEPESSSPAGQEACAVISPPVDISVARRRFLSGGRLSREEVEALVGAISQQPDLATSRENIRGGTLLHWSAVHGLVTEAKALLEAGADASAGNGDGRRPHELAENLELRSILEAALAIRRGAAAGGGGR